MSDGWAGLLGYTDEGFAQVKFIDSPADPVPTAVWRVALGDQPGDPDEVAGVLLRLGTELEAGDLFLLDRHRHYMSWGADAAFWTVAISFATSVLTGLTQDVVRERIRSVLSQLASGSGEQEVPQRDTALIEAERAVVSNWNVDRAALDLRSEGEDRQAKNRKFVFRDPAGCTYTVIVGVIGGSPFSHYVERSLD